MKNDDKARFLELEKNIIKNAPDGLGAIYLDYDVNDKNAYSEALKAQKIMQEKMPNITVILGLPT